MRITNASMAVAALLYGGRIHCGFAVIYVCFVVPTVVVADELALPSVPYEFHAKFYEMKKKAQKFDFSGPIEDELQARGELVSTLEKYYGASHYETIFERQEFEHAKRIKNLDKDHRELAYKARERRRTALTFEAERNAPKALEFYSDALSINQDLFGDNDCFTLRCMDRVAFFQFQTGKEDLAFANANAAVRLSREMYHEKHPLIALHIATLATLEAYRGRTEVADGLINEALAMDDATDYLEHAEHAKRLILKAKLLNRTKRFADAASIAKQASSLAANGEPTLVDILVYSQAELAKSYFGQGKFNSCTAVVERMSKHLRTRRDDIPSTEQIELMSAYHDSLIALRRNEEAALVAESITEERQRVTPKLK